MYWLITLIRYRTNQMEDEYTIPIPITTTIMVAITFGAVTICMTIVVISGLIYYGIYNTIQRPDLDYITMMSITT